MRGYLRLSAVSVSIVVVLSIGVLAFVASPVAATSVADAGEFESNLGSISAIDGSLADRGVGIEQHGPPDDAGSGDTGQGGPGEGGPGQGGPGEDGQGQGGPGEGSQGQGGPGEGSQGQGGPGQDGGPGEGEGAPDSDQERGPPEDQGEGQDTVAAVQTSQQGDQTHVEGTVSNAAAETPVGLEVSTEGDGDAAELTGLSVTPAVDTSFSLDLVESSTALDRSPDFDPGDGTAPLSFMSVEHSIGNANIEEVTITYRVDTESLAAMDSSPEDVSLYRYTGEGWTEQPTQVVDIEDGEAIIQTTADGLSEWTAAAKRPRFNVTDTEVDVRAATTDDEVTIQVFVANTGGTDGVYEAELLLNGGTVDSVERTVPDGGTVALNFERTFDQPGLYEVQVNDVFIGEVNISAVEESVEVDTADTDEAAIQAVEVTDTQVEEDVAEAGGGSLPVLPLGVVLVLIAGFGVWGYLTRVGD